MSKTFKIMVNRNFALNSIDLFLYQRIGEKTAIVKNMTMETIADDQLINLIDLQPVIMETRDAQELMDELWNCGIRPTDTRDRSEVVNAKEKHILDLQKVLDAFIKIAIEGGKK